MNTVVIGISHKITPISIREKLYLSLTERERFLAELKSSPLVVEAIVLSTCNRTEIYASLIEGESPERLIALLFKVKNLQMTLDLKGYFYTYFDQDAVKHLFYVVTSLDSLVLGEKQILGQVKDAIELSRKHGMLSKQFNILSDAAIRAGKKAQTETRIGYGGVSISWASVIMAQRMLGELKGKSVLIIGAGKMSTLATRQLAGKGIGQIYVMNRTKENAVSLAEKFHGKAVSFWEIKDILARVDVCVCSASAPHYLIEKKLIVQVMEQRTKELLCIDISTPRNVDPAVAEVENVSLVTIDDLKQVVDDNLESRQTAINKVEEIINKKIDEFNNKMNKGGVYEGEALYF